MKKTKLAVWTQDTPRQKVMEISSDDIVMVDVMRCRIHGDMALSIEGEQISAGKCCGRWHPDGIPFKVYKKELLEALGFIIEPIKD